MATADFTLCWYLFSEAALRESMERVQLGRSVDDEVMHLYVQGHPSEDDPTPGGVRVFEVDVICDKGDET